MHVVVLDMWPDLGTGLTKLGNELQRVATLLPSGADFVLRRERFLRRFDNPFLVRRWPQGFQNSRDLRELLRGGNVHALAERVPV